MINDTNISSEKDQKIMKFALDIDYQIVKGDMVTVDFLRSHSLYNAEVLSTPNITGDPWILKCENGNIIYVSLYEKITKQTLLTSSMEIDDAPF